MPTMLTGDKAASMSSPRAPSEDQASVVDSSERFIPTTMLVHKFVLKKRCSAGSHDEHPLVDPNDDMDDDESNVFELEAGENWLRLLSSKEDSGRHSILDDTQDMSQETASMVLYPSILSLHSTGGGVATSSECYVCLDVDGSTLAIKDMRLPIEEPETTDDDEHEHTSKVRSSAAANRLGLGRCYELLTSTGDATHSIRNREWELLPRRQLRILRPGDCLCTSLVTSKCESGDTPGGLVLEYLYGPKTEPPPPSAPSPLAHGASTATKDDSQKAISSLGLLTQPIEDDEDADDDDDDDDDEETHTEPSAPQTKPETKPSSNGNDTNEEDSSNGPVIMEEDSMQLEEERKESANQKTSKTTASDGCGTNKVVSKDDDEKDASFVGGGSDTESDATQDLTQLPPIALATLPSSPATPPPSTNLSSTDVTASNDIKPPSQDTDDESYKTQAMKQLPLTASQDLLPASKNVSPVKESLKRDYANGNVESMDDSGDDSDKTEDMTQIPMAVPDLSRQTNVGESLLLSTQPIQEEASDDETTLGGDDNPVISNDPVDATNMDAEAPVVKSTSTSTSMTPLEVMIVIDDKKDTDINDEKAKAKANSQDATNGDALIDVSPTQSPKKAVANEETPGDKSQKDLIDLASQEVDENLVREKATSYQKKKHDLIDLESQQAENGDPDLINLESQKLPQDLMNMEIRLAEKSPTQSRQSEGGDLINMEMEKIMETDRDRNNRDDTPGETIAGSLMNAEWNEDGTRIEHPEGDLLHLKPDQRAQVDPDGRRAGEGHTKENPPIVANSQAVEEHPSQQGTDGLRESSETHEHDIPSTETKTRAIPPQMKDASIESSAKSTEERVSPFVSTPVKDRNLPEQDEPDEKVTESAATLSPVSGHESQSTEQCSVLPSHGVSPSMLRETGEETTLSPMPPTVPSTVAPQRTAPATTRPSKDDNDSEITDIDEEPEKILTETDVLDRDDADSEITDVEGEPEADAKTDTPTKGSPRGTSNKDSAATPSDTKKDDSVDVLAIVVENADDQTTTPLRHTAATVNDDAVVDMTGLNKGNRKRHLDNVQASADEKQISLKKARTFKKEKNNPQSDQEIDDEVEPISEKDDTLTELPRKRKRTNSQSLASTPVAVTEAVSITKRRTPKQTATPQKQSPQVPNDSVSSSTRKRRRGTPATPATPATPSVDGDEATIRVMATGVVFDQKLKNMVKRIGGVFLGDLTDAASATHVVAASAEIRLKRTPKLLVALCCTNNIIHVDWLKESAAKREALETTKFLLLKETEAEKQYTFSMRGTLQRAFKMRVKGALLFAGHDMYLCTGVAGSKMNGNKTPPKQEFRLILEAAGANLVETLPVKRTTFAKTIIIVSNLEKEANKQVLPNRVADALKKGAITKTTEEVFGAIMNQMF